MDGVRDLDHIDLGMELKLGWREPVNKTLVASSVKKSGKPKRTSNQMRQAARLLFTILVNSHMLVMQQELKTTNFHKVVHNLRVTIYLLTFVTSYS